MKHFPVILFAITVAVLSGFPHPAAAGQACQDAGLNVDYVQRAVAAARELEADLDQAGPRVAILARVGSDIGEHGLKYTHAGFVQRAGGKWIVTHLLNECGTGRSHLARQGLLEFMMDDLLNFDVLVTVPTPPLQNALAQAIASGAARALYEPNYSLISNPSGPLRHQNSNHWMLDVIAQAQAAGENQRLVARRDTQAYFLSKGFVGSPIKISSLERLGASLTRPNVHFDDHPRSSERAGKYQVVSVKSLVTYLRRNNQVAALDEFRPAQTVAFK